MNKQLDLEDLKDDTVYYEDLEIGDYVRFIDYDMINTGQEKVIKIGQVEAKYSDILEIKLNNILTKIKKCSSREIIKYHKDIKELVEEGDYVNGMLVRKGKVASGEEKLLIGNHIIHGMALEAVNIKSIVTKEDFESREYKVGE